MFLEAQFWQPQGIKKPSALHSRVEEEETECKVSKSVGNSDRVQNEDIYGEMQIWHSGKNRSTLKSPIGVIARVDLFPLKVRSSGRMLWSLASDLTMCCLVLGRDPDVLDYGSERGSQEHNGEDLTKRPLVFFARAMGYP